MDRIEAVLGYHLLEVRLVIWLSLAVSLVLCFQAIQQFRLLEQAHVQYVAHQPAARP